MIKNDPTKQEVLIMNKKNGILVVSFGTSYEDTRKKTIGAIEAAIQKAYPHIPVYSAWTSRIIRTKLFKNTGEKIYSVEEALAQMEKDGVSNVFVQTTHVINGIEYESMKKDAAVWECHFDSIAFGKPLLSSTEDMKELICMIADEFSEIINSDKASETALVLMGHGTEHHSNTGYAALDDMCKEMGYPNIHVGTVESYPSLTQIIPLLKNAPVKTVHLAPLMIVAGDHASNDMAGSSKNSWVSQLTYAGYDVTCHLKGLGQYSDVRRLFLKHLKEILS